MNSLRKLQNWCRRPLKRTSTIFTRFTTLLCISILIGGLLLTIFAAIVLLPQILFPSVFRLFSYVDESGRVTEVVERMPFPGGAIVVYKHPVDYPHPTWYISIKVHNYITSEEDLLAYVNSRTNALDELLNSLSINRKVQITVTFKEPLEPSDFKNLYENYFAESEGPNHSAIIVKNETSGKLETIILSAPSPEYLEEFMTYPKEGLKMISVISLEAFLEANVVKSVTQDPRILLIDPQEGRTVRGLEEKYSLMGFDVTVDRPPILVRVFQPELTWSATTIENLLTDPSKYNHWRLYFIGNVSDLDSVENTFFKLNDKLLVSYKCYGIDLSEQIATEDIKNGDCVKVVGTFFQERSALYADKIEKVKEAYSLPLTADELLADASRYDGQTVQVFGRVNDFGYMEDPFFELDGKLLVCYRYDNIDLSSQIGEVQDGDPMIVIGIFYHNDMTLYARHIRPSKEIGQ